MILFYMIFSEIKHAFESICFTPAAAIKVIIKLKSKDSPGSCFFL